MNKEVSTFISGVNFLFVKIKMKQRYVLAFLLSLAFIPNVFAVDVFSGTLNEDLFFPDGVRLSGVNHPGRDIPSFAGSIASTVLHVNGVRQAWWSLISIVSAIRGPQVPARYGSGVTSFCSQ